MTHQKGCFRDTEATVGKMNLTQKETELLKDLKGQEELCVEKYTKHAEAANDPQLKNLFSSIAGIERSHLQTVTAMANGALPSGQGNVAKPRESFTAVYGQAESAEKKADAYLCSDVLTMEKHASHLYDTCIFEFTDENARNTLNHIQKEEQEHGKMLYDYMNANGMYC